jgi:hypothetical protein
MINHRIVPLVRAVIEGDLRCIQPLLDILYDDDDHRWLPMYRLLGRLIDEVARIEAMPLAAEIIQVAEQNEVLDDLDIRPISSLATDLMAGTSNDPVDWADDTGGEDATGLPDRAEGSFWCYYRFRKSFQSLFWTEADERPINETLDWIDRVLDVPAQAERLKNMDTDAEPGDDGDFSPADEDEV